MEVPRLHVQRKIAVESSNIALLDVVCVSNLVACTTSNQLIKVYSLETGSLLSQYKGHTARISKLCHCYQQPQLLYSSGEDKTVRVWDLRQKLEVKLLLGDSILYSVDVSADNKLLAAGGKKHVFVWDVASSSRIGTYSDIHQEEIVEVKFHPSTNELYSGSFDGLVCVFDCTLGSSEDETYLSALNIEQSVNKMGFFGPDNNLLYCTTVTESMSIWDLKEESHVSFPLDFREKLSSISQLDISYLVNCLWHSTSNVLFLLAGTNDGTVGMFSVNGLEVGYSFILPSAHSDVVRGVSCRSNMETIVTVGDDGLLCVWKQEDVHDPPQHQLKQVRSASHLKNVDLF